MAVKKVITTIIVSTTTEEQRSNLKNICTKHQLDVMPLDRAFMDHEITMREESIENTITKLKKLKEGI